ncbi:MAG: hypothetical protein MUF09_09800 [Candidatus Nanopelagicales bacterium]|nr:hypothetical protein [Candidatus Nanopelagicales bacterium]
MNLDPRSSNRAWTQVPNPTSIGVGRPVVTENRPEGNPVHRLWIGNRRVILDLSTGVGYEHNFDRGSARVLSGVESRLVLLDWTRAWMPLRSPSALWAIEAAGLAAGSAPLWREWASSDLNPALAALLNSGVEWSAAARCLIEEAATAAEVDASSVDGQLLAAVIDEVAQARAALGEGRDHSAPAPEYIPRCSEVEWDRVAAAGVDLGEHGIRSSILGTVWTASVAQHPRLRAEGRPERLWARLVDDASGVVYDEALMRWADGLYVARGYVSSTARRVPTRIDLITDPATTARTGAQRRRVLWQQGWFRMLFFARRESTAGSWADWSGTYRARFGAGSAESVVGSPSGSPAASRIGGPIVAEAVVGPFLAERHLRPSDLASVRQSLLSPGDTTLPPSTT